MPVALPESPSASEEGVVRRGLDVAIDIEGPRRVARARRSNRDAILVVANESLQRENETVGDAALIV